MRRGPNGIRWLLTMIVSAILVLPVLAATPAEQLEKAAELFKAGDYEAARQVLLDIPRDGLDDAGKQRRDEMVDEVTTAINQSTKARQNLEDAEKAFDANDRARAERLFRAVQENTYATPQQKARARQGLALIAKQRELEGRLPGATTRPAANPERPANVNEVTPPPAPAGEELEFAAPTTRPVERVEISEEARAARAERLREEASRLIREGDEAVAQGQYDQAELRFQEALRAVPNHPDALKGLEIVRQHRAVEGTPNLLEQSEARRRARWDRTERLFQQNESQIRGLVNNRQYDEARRLLAVTRQMLEAARADARPPERYTILSSSLESLGRYIDEEQRELQQEEALQQRRQALEAERRRRAQDLKERDERIGQLLEQAMQLRKQREFEKAADVLREVLTIDPSYERAAFMLEAMEDAHLIQKQKLTHEKFLQQYQRAIVETENTRTPEVVGVGREIYAFPSEDEWRIISQRDPYGATSETDQDRAARRQMSQILADVVFPDGTTFEEAVNFLRDRGRISLDVNWNALTLVGIERTSPVSLDLHNVKLETALELLLENVGGALGVQLGFDVVDGVVRVSTIEELNRKTFPRVYDVTDLLVQIRSFEAPDEQMGGIGGGGFGIAGGGFGGGFGGGGFGGGFGGGGFGGSGGFGSSSRSDDDDDSSEEDRRERVQELEELIRNLIEPGTWLPEGTIGSLQIWNDRLIVRHTANAHRQLADLFKQLRESKDLQVSIEARFLTMTSNFLEEIGVDLDIILNNGNAGYDPALTDPVTGTQLLLPRQFGRTGFAPAVPGFGSPLAGQTAIPQPYQNVALVPTGRPTNWWSRHTTPVPILNNSIDLAQPVATIVPGSDELVSKAVNTPGFQIFGSFLDNIQLDFLMRATQLDVRSSSVEAPRLVVFNNRRAYISVGTTQSFIFTPGFLPAGGSGVGGQSAQGQNPTIGIGFSGRVLDVLPTVSADRKYVTMELRPRIQVFSTQTRQSALGPLDLSRTETTEIRTNAVVPDQGTILLGGLKLAGENEVEAGVPILSKVPALKRLFTNRSRVKDEQITLILIKPTIVIPEEQEDLAYPSLVGNRAVSGVPGNGG